jgi:hypothetical protein
VERSRCLFGQGKLSPDSGKHHVNKYSVDQVQRRKRTISAYNDHQKYIWEAHHTMLEEGQACMAILQACMVYDASSTPALHRAAINHKRTYTQQSRNQQDSRIQHTVLQVTSMSYEPYCG